MPGPHAEDLRGLVVAATPRYIRGLIPLHIRHLTKRYGQFTALSDVSFSIRSGEVLGLIGPNGSGKTTLFECLAGVLPFDEGAITQDEKALTPSQRASMLFYLPDAIAPWPAQPVRWALRTRSASSAAARISTTMWSAAST